MLFDKIVAVVVPAYNEEKQIGQVLETMPDFVNRIIVVNDCSPDKTAATVLDYIINKNRFNHYVKNNVRNSLDNKYNRVEHLLKEKQQTEIEHFIPSEITNANPESDRIILINNLKNGGVGAAIARGYKWCLDNHIDCTAVMAGDGQIIRRNWKKYAFPLLMKKLIMSKAIASFMAEPA